MTEIGVKGSEALVKAVEAAVAEAGNNVPETLAAALSSGSTTFSVDHIAWLHKNAKGIRLHELLKGCEVVLPEPVVLPRSPELEARVQRLRLEQQDREYRRMTKDVDSVRVHYPEDTIAYQLKQINRQLIAVVQFIFSVGAGFVFGFLGIELLVGDLEFGFRLLLGVMCSLVIALAEIYFLAKKLAEDYDPPPIPPRVKPHTD